MTEPTMSELLRLNDLLRLDEVGEEVPKQMLELRFRRLYAAYAIKFGWPFCETGEYAEDPEEAWRRWASMEVRFSL